jgi:hypothetical protein
MSIRGVLLGAAAAVGAGVVVLSCAPSPGDLRLVNNGAVDIEMVAVGQHVTVTAGGEVDVLGVGCVSDVLVELPGSDPVTIAGPVCPEDSVVVTREGTVLLSEGPDRS